ncbi:putative elongation factor EF-G, partial [Toxoplasma gondii p89]
LSLLSRSVSVLTLLISLSLLGWLFPDVLRFRLVSRVATRAWWTLCVARQFTSTARMARKSALTRRSPRLSALPSRTRERSSSRPSPTWTTASRRSTSSAKTSVQKRKSTRPFAERLSSGSSSPSLWARPRATRASSLSWTQSADTCLRPELPVGQLTYLRLYQGKLKKGDSVVNVSTQKRSSPIKRILQMHADEAREVPHAVAGDIVAVSGLECNSGTTFTSDAASRLSLSSMFVPEPVVSLSVNVKKKDDQQRFAKALNRFQREDPTFR